MKEPNFLTSKARKAFNYLKQAFTKASVFQHFDPKCYIWIETNISGYTMGRVQSQLIFNQLTLLDSIFSKSDFDQEYLVAYFSKKIIFAKTCYKTHNEKFLAIIQVFKTWCHYLKGCKHKVFVLTNHNNLFCFMVTKSLSFKQVC